MTGFSNYDLWKTTPPDWEGRTVICGECGCEFYDNEPPNCSIPNCQMIYSEPAGEEFCDDVES